MFGRKKEPKPTPRSNAAGQRGKNQLGLLDMGGLMEFDPSSMDDLYGDDDDDDLEAELMGIMSGKKAPTNRPKRKGPASLDVMIAESLKDIPSDEEESSDVENDAALLAELQELTPEETTPEDFPSAESPSPPKIPSPVRPARSAPAPPDTADLMAHTDLMDAPPEIPPKSAALSLVGLIEERRNMYQTAIANAKLAGESSKVRRLDRGLKTLESQLKSAKAGKAVNEDDIPPVVATGASAARTPTSAPSPPTEQVEEPMDTNSLLTPSAPPVSPEHIATPARVPSPVIPPVEESPLIPQATTSEAPSDDNESLRHLLLQRKEQYKQAALQAKKDGDKAQAISYIKIVKQFEAVTGALEQGQPIDLSQMPPPPPGFEANSSALSSAVISTNPVPTPRTTANRTQGSAAVTESAPAMEEVAIPDGPPDPSLFNAPPAPSTILEALIQRRDKYLSSQKEAEEQQNSSKARRMGRIVKQYDDAIKMYKAGKPVQYDELPDPPGFAPIPRDGQSAAPPSATAQGPQAPPRPAAPTPRTQEPATKIAESSDPSVPGGAPPPIPARKAPGTVPPSVPPAASLQPQQPGANLPSPRNTAASRQEKQLQLLQHRQQMFREAALEAKKRGDIPAAKEYLRQSKGFGPMIEASRCGLPVNLDSAPIPPQMTHDDSFEVVEHEDCQPPGDRDEIFERLDHDLRLQIAMCIRNRDHFAQLGDVASSNKFQQLGENTKKDLTSVKYANKRGDAAPRFHYEMRTFSIVQCFTDLTDNELDLTIVRGLNYACPNPKEVDTFVRFEFPFPTENPPHDRTHVVKDTNNPEYNKSFTLPIARKSRALLRTFKRGTIKLEVISKGGFLRSSVVLGTVHVKLAPLETKCLIHDCFDLMDGRKPVGGKLEVKVRIRDPLLSKQVEEIKEKWLIIDEYAGK